MKDRLEDENKDLMSLAEMTEEIDRCYDEFDQTMDDMMKMRNKQLQEGGDVKCVMMRDMLSEVSGQVDEWETKEKNILRDIEIAAESEKKLKEELHIAKNKLAIAQDKRRKELESKGDRGFNGRQNNFNRRF